MRKDASVWRNESYLYKRIESFSHMLAIKCQETINKLLTLKLIKPILLFLIFVAQNSLCFNSLTQHLYLRE